MEQFQKALAYHESLQTDSVPARIAKWTIARTLRSQEKFEEALAMQKEVLAAWEKSGREDGYVFEEIGECLLALEKAGEAKEWFRKAHKALSQDGRFKQNEPERLERLEKLGSDSGAEG